MVAVGSCLLVAGGDEPTVEILDTYRHRVWNLPPVKKAGTLGCSMLAVDKKIAVIGGEKNPWCATFGIMDKDSWCFRRLCEHEPTSGIIIGKDRGTEMSMEHPSARTRARTSTCRGDNGEDVD